MDEHMIPQLTRQPQSLVTAEEERLLVVAVVVDMSLKGNFVGKLLRTLVALDMTVDFVAFLVRSVRFLISTDRVGVVRSQMNQKAFFPIKVSHSGHYLMALKRNRCACKAIKLRNLHLAFFESFFAAADDVLVACKIRCIFTPLRHRPST
jgi:hypothetical protein